jgi:hypothetical protein
MTIGVDNFRYETWELDELVSAVEPLNPFMLEKFFSYGTVLSDAATIEWDIEERGQRLAPFVSPFVPGREIKSTGHMTAVLKPAYVKPAKTLFPSMGYVRQPGEPYGGTLSPRERMDRLLARQISLHDEMLTNRMNWMAVKALTDGQIVISGDDYPAVTVDFGQNSDLRVATLSSGARWSQTTAVPLDDIENLALDIREKSYGAVADTVVMDGLAWGYFRTRMQSNVLFDQTLAFRNGSTIDMGPRNTMGAQQVGTLAGRFGIWVYDGQYEDNEGVLTPFMTAYSALVVASGDIQGKQYFGAIMDLEANLQPIRMFHKTEKRFDPSGLHLVSQSAPAIAPRRRNAFGRLVVHQ